MDITIFANGVYAAGSYTASTSIASGVAAGTFTLQRTLFSNNQVVIKVTVDLSLDGGSTWNPHPSADPFPLGGSTIPGGTDPTTTIGFRIPQSSSSTRQLRFTMTVLNGSFNSTGTLTV